MNSLTITLADLRAIDGWVEAANRANMTPEAMALELLQHQGTLYANLFRIGILTSAAFVQRFTADEYGAIREAAQESPEVAGLVQQLVETPTVVLSDERLAPALVLLTEAGLLQPGRAEELTSWEHPSVPPPPEEPEADA